jgi:ribosomal protein S3AE
MAQAKKRKKFFEAELPLINKQIHLIAYEPSELDGKIIKYDLTRLLKGKNMILQAVVKKEGSKFTAVPNKIEIVHSALSRMVRKGTNYIEDSFSTNCENAQVKIKPFLVSRRKTHRSVRKALRNKAREELINYVKDKTAEQIFEEIIRNQLQKTLSLILKKTYPLSACEIRVFEVEKSIEPKPKKTEEPKKTAGPENKE